MGLLSRAASQAGAPYRAWADAGPPPEGRSLYGRASRGALYIDPGPVGRLCLEGAAKRRAPASLSATLWNPPKTPLPPILVPCGRAFSGLAACRKSLILVQFFLHILSSVFPLFSAAAARARPPAHHGIPVF